jgi:hypothetical protein
MPDWNKMLLTNMEFAEERLKESGEIGAMAILHCPDNVVNVIAMDMTSDAMKQRSMKLVRLLAVAHDAEAVAMLGEMWMRAMSPYDGESEAAYQARVTAVRPRDAEDRREVVMANLYYRDDAGAVVELSQTREILRDWDGKPTGLAPADDVEVLFSEGDLTNVMPPEKPTAEQVRYARQLLDRSGLKGTRLR